MATSFVFSYSINTTNGSSFTLTFSIPDNCEYSISVVEGVYWIYVKLKTGETVPSNKYVTYTEKLDLIKGVVSVQFEQECDGTTTILRPKIRIDE